MKVSLNIALNDTHIDASQARSQRQLSIALAAVAQPEDRKLPLNLCLVLDRSGSMSGKPIERVKQAALKLVEKLSPSDRLSVIGFNHHAQILIPNQIVTDLNQVKNQIQKLEADGGTCIDDALKMGLKETAKGKIDTVSQIFLLTDGENEHGDNERCLKLAKLASEYNITLNSLGFGSHWNQDVLENIADQAGGTLCYIEKPEQAVAEFSRLFERIQSVGLTNAYLLLELISTVKLAELKAIAQVAPETIELPIKQQENNLEVRLGDLMTEEKRIVLVNFYVSQLPPGEHTIGNVQIRYDDPALSSVGLLSEKLPVTVEVQQLYQPQIDEQVQKSILTLAKYRQTQIAEQKLKQGDRTGAATLLQTAAKTALQLGDQGGATVLQTSATRLQAGEELSEAERKKTRIVSKTIIQDQL